jgi:hypothetical protein
MAAAAEATDMNLDLMVAKVPHWFMRLSGWEGRLVVRAGMRAAATQGVRAEAHLRALTSPDARVRASGQALKADIALIFGVKPETKDGEACMKVRVRGGGNVLPVLRGAARMRARAGKSCVSGSCVDCAHRRRGAE